MLLRSLKKNLLKHLFWRDSIGPFHFTFRWMPQRQLLGSLGLLSVYCDVDIECVEGTFFYWFISLMWIWSWCTMTWIWSWFVYWLDVVLWRRSWECQRHNCWLDCWLDIIQCCGSKVCLRHNCWLARPLEYDNVIWFGVYWRKNYLLARPRDYGTMMGTWSKCWLAYRLYPKIVVLWHGSKCVEGTNVDWIIGSTLRLWYYDVDLECEKCTIVNWLVDSMLWLWHCDMGGMSLVTWISSINRVDDPSL